MTIYNINFGIGWASSGVEYAQAYRAQMLRETNQSAKFVFLDFIQTENIQTFTSNMGFKDEEIIWLYQYFTDIKIAPTTYQLEQLKASLGAEVTRTEYVDKKVRLYLDGRQNFVTCYLKDENDTVVDRAEFVINGILVRKDFYSYVRVFSEYYAPFENYAKLYMRQFYNEDGSIAYNEYIDGEDSIFAFENTKLYSKIDFVSYFIQQLQLTSKDIVILDRATQIGQAVLQHKGESKIGVVVHAEHFSKHIMNDEQILWNNYYEYQFSNAREIDFFITATDLQNKVLREQFQKYYKFQPNILTVPVGSLSSLKKPNSSRKPFSMVTASRLASEKHIDWLVKAAIMAKKQVPELTFDIYGEGGEKDKIMKIVEANEATNYIQLLGHVNLDQVYQQYELFVSASTSEGFGLTLMEAVGSGLGMIGFDVNYGNPTFIRNEANGYLIPIDLNDDHEHDIVQRLAQYMVKYFNEGLAHPHETSYEIAKDYMTQEVVDKWNSLIKEVLYD